MTTLLHKIIRADKVMVFCASLVTMLILTAVSSPTALAANPGDPLRLGEENTIVGPTTSLVGNSDPTLEIVNRSSTAGSPALRLVVNPKVPPLVVNDAAGKATNLDADKLDGRDSTTFADAIDGKAKDADKLDGRDSTTFANGTNGKANSAFSADNADKLDGKDSLQFWSGKLYDVLSGAGTGTSFGNNVYSISASCDAGDALLHVGGGGLFGSGEVLVRTTIEGTPPIGTIFVQKPSPNIPISAAVRCADFPPLRP